AEYGQAGRRAYEGILREFIEVRGDGSVDIHRVCQVAGLGGDPERGERYRDGTFEYYVGEKVRSNDPKAVGPFIFASLEMERREEARPAAAKVATRGGLAGRVVRVTSLEAGGPGSLREALDTRGPRLVVFDVGGVIDLGGRSLSVRQPHLTVAGQTAPDPGVTLIRGGLVVETHDVVLQHLAVRPGDGVRGGGRWEPDALGVRRGPEGVVHGVVFDHCSATWAVDENLSLSGPADATPAQGPDATARDVTLTRCLVAEALSRSTHGKGEHSKGTLVHDGVRGVAIKHSLYAHNRDRNPRLKGGTRAVFSGNLVYNWGSSCVGVGTRGNRRRLEPAEAVVA
ncbi:MAG TPA: glycoside hydrolase family 88 protein, partial [Vicinamibacteria bacterium]|nr:glycoside hydrolase family 88 protein [Vicinamibacteria bacterium]